MAPLCLAHLNGCTRAAHLLRCTGYAMEHMRAWGIPFRHACSTKTRRTSSRLCRSSAALRQLSGSRTHHLVAQALEGGEREAGDPVLPDDYAGDTIGGRIGQRAVHEAAGGLECPAARVRVEAANVERHQSRRAGAQAVPRQHYRPVSARIRLVLPVKPVSVLVRICRCRNVQFCSCPHTPFGVADAESSGCP